MFGIDDIALGGLGALGGGLLQGIGAYYGGQAQAKAYKQAADQANQRWQQAYSDSSPYRTGGTNALNLYNTATGVNGTEGQQKWASGLSSDPGFAAATKYGLDQIQARNAAQGLGLSGNEAAGLSDYSQKNLLGYEQQSLDNLFREANLGAGVTNQSMASSTGASNVIGNLQGNAGSSIGSSYAGLGNGAYSGANNLAQYYYNYNKAS